MGYGVEDPVRFNPVQFNANQWAMAAKAGGFKGMVITSKHHDGFCNWRTQTTSHNVASSPWKKGSGDVVLDVAKACRKAGIQFGITENVGLGIRGRVLHINDLEFEDEEDCDHDVDVDLIKSVEAVLSFTW